MNLSKRISPSLFFLIVLLPLTYSIDFTDRSSSQNFDIYNSSFLLETTQGQDGTIISLPNAEFYRTSENQNFIIEEVVASSNVNFWDVDSNSPSNDHPTKYNFTCGQNVQLNYGQEQYTLDPAIPQSQQISFPPEFPQDVIDSNYNMKAFAYFEISNGTQSFNLPLSNYDGSYDYPGVQTILSGAIVQYDLSNLVFPDALSPDPLPINGDGSTQADTTSSYILLNGNSSTTIPNDAKNYLEALCDEDSNWCQDFNVTLHVIPFDGKCDNNNLDMPFGDGTLNDTEIEFMQNTTTLSIRPSGTVIYGDYEVEENSLLDQAPTEIQERFKEVTDSYTIKYIPPRRTYANLTDGSIHFIDESGYEQKITIDSSQRRVALLSNKIQLKDTKEEVESFVQNDLDLKDEYQPSEQITRENNVFKRSITLDYTPGSELTVYKVFPKGFDVSQIRNTGSARMFVKDKDPVIGWHIDDDDDTITYEQDDAQGGTTVLSNDPVLYNDGALTVNYRETACDSSEAHLFDIDDLESSPIYTPNGDKLYRVCVGHLSEDLDTNPSGMYTLNIFNYTDGDDLVFGSSAGEELIISNENLDSWELEVQETNPGGFSCLGSYDSDGYFGDCNYNESNRIWLALETDLQGPQIEFSFPTLSHTIPLTIEVQDESGVEYFKYCVSDEETGCDPSGEDKITQDSTTFQLTCPHDWGCIKYVSVLAQDDLGKQREVTQEFRLIDKGSSCRADCTASPSPNRFLSECNRLNGCFYASHPNDAVDKEGETVAELCDFLTPGAYAQYNETHDIQCPSGPLRESRYTNVLISTAGSSCDLVKTTPFVGFLEGQQIILSLISCIEFN